MKKLVIIGAGRLGKGFIGEVFNNANWDMTFIDTDKKVIDKLNEKGEYLVDVHRVDRIDHRIVKGYSAYTWENQGANKSIVQSDLIMMSLYPKDFAQAFKDMEKALNERYQNCYDHQLTIIALTNKNHLMDEFAQMMREGKSKQYIQWLDQNVALRDSIIRRSTDAETNTSLKIRTTAVLSLLIQKLLFVSVEDVEWMELIDNLELLKDLKVFSVNGPHVTSAFAAHYYGYEIWNDAIKNEKVQALMNKVSDEITATILKIYPISKEDLTNLSFFPLAKGEMEDTVYRIAKDPIRKLSNNDRLVGIAKIAEENNLPIDGLSKAIALGYLYDNPKDETALTLQQYIRENGIKQAIIKFSGIDKTSDLYKKVLLTYKNYQNISN